MKMRDLDNTLYAGKQFVMNCDKNREDAPVYMVVKCVWEPEEATHVAMNHVFVVNIGSGSLNILKKTAKVLDSEVTLVD